MDVDSVMKRSRMVQKNAWSQESRDTTQGLKGHITHQPSVLGMPHLDLLPFLVDKVDDVSWISPFLPLEQW